MTKGEQSIMSFLNLENRTLRALLWCVLVLVPGGFFLAALLAAEAVRRRYVTVPRAAREAELTEASLPGIASH